MLLGGAYLYARLLAFEEAKTLAHNDAIARGVAAAIETREEGYANLLLSYAGRFRFREAVKRQDRGEALIHLRQLAESFPELDRPFLADPAGVVWALYPEESAVYGRSFAQRDWYRGVSREWRPYMSEVFESATAERPLVVTLVAPIRDADGTVIGIIGSAQRLEVIRRWLLPFQIPGGDLYIVDRKGQFVFHRTRVGPEHLSDYARVPDVERLLRGEAGTAEVKNPVEGEVRLNAYRPLPSLGWGLVVHQAKDLAVHRLRTLIVVSGTVGLVLVVALGVLGGVALQTHRKTVRAQKELDASNRFLSSVIENIPNMVFVKDATELRFVRLNKAGEELLGYPRQELIGKNDYDFFPKDQAEFFVASDRAVLTTGILRDIPEEAIETRHQGTRILHTKKIPIVDEHRRPTHLLGISEDVTDRKRAEEALVGAREEAERANRAKSDFLSRMSHELRTPLNAILGFAQVLDLDALEPAQRESVSHILKGGRHLLALIDEVLDIARIEAGRLRLSLEAVAVRTVMDEARSLIRPLADGRKIQLRVEVPEPSTLHVRADRQRLKQVLLNLLSNAIKYNREGGVVTLACEDRPEGNRVRLRVVDMGPGISPERLARLFTPFDRLGAEATGVEGTGLGLALSRALAEAMGGALSVVSEVGRGSTFWVELDRAESPEPEILEAAAQVSGGPTLKNGAVVLYIEDNPSNVHLIEHVLARRPGVKLLTTMQGRLGLALASEHRPGLILLDLHLPDISGTEVLRQLQDEPRTRGIRVVVLSADASPGQARQLLDAGAHAYLTKPIDVREFLRVLDQTLENGG
jgi:PAS domain S-box-containing protein